METFNIKIAGEIFPIKSDGDKEQVMLFAKQIQNRFDAIDNKTGPIGTRGLRTMTMVALQLLDELNESKSRNIDCDKKILDEARQLSNQIELILSK